MHDISQAAGQVVGMLERWLAGAERYVTESDDGLAWYGAGYPGWGMQTVYKWIAAAAVIAEHGSTESVRHDARQRALAGLRYAIHTHRTGSRPTTDGRPWDSTWISVLGPERAAFAIDLLHDQLDPEDQAMLRRQRIAEATWLVDDNVRGTTRGIQADRWASSGKNAPESNIWNGTHLWRTAQAYPDCERRDDYLATAVESLLNGVSIEADATSDAVVDGHRVANLHRGANFFDSYALDHHGYLNLGYMVICASNVAIAHQDFVRQGWPVPESLHWHQRELWQRIRPCIGPDGRLIRIGGDSRVRYAYCQEYLLPSLLYAERVLGDAGAAELAEAGISLCGTEQAENADGSFYGRRLRGLAERRPYYYTRIEGDRAVALAWWLHHAGPGRTVTNSTASAPEQMETIDLDRVAWDDPDHGFVMVRGARRVASVSRRAHTLTQTLVIPTARPDFAEWSMNLCPLLQWEDAKPPASLTETSAAHRRVVDHHQQRFDGGFATLTRVAEGLDLTINEGWHSRRDVPAATTTMVVVAAPDDATVVGLQICRIGDYHAPLVGSRGLNLLVPDDVYNGHRRSLVGLPTESGSALLIDDQLEVRVPGRLETRTFSVDDDPALRSIGIVQVSADPRQGAFFAHPGAVVVDVPWAIRIHDAGPTPFRFERRQISEDVHELVVHDDAGTHHVLIDLAEETASPLTVDW
ncbi:hypothetical protein [Microlunatus sp. Y2014]|uniref:hypothetical protein n=1 Tax=Microlunatus sp. Y2014 TaxID=3418488 RepID=UPI003DA74EE0